MVYSSASYKLKVIKLSPTLEPQNLAYWKLDIAGEINLLNGIFNGIGQVFFLDNTYLRHHLYCCLLGGKKLGFMQSSEI